MSSDISFQQGCSERYAELCALSTTGELSAGEVADLNKHLAGCGPCAELLKEYTSLAQVGMAKLASELEPETQPSYPFRRKKAEHRLLRALQAPPHIEQSETQLSTSPFLRANAWWKGAHPAVALTAAVVLLICIGSAFELGRRMTPFPSHSRLAAVVRPPAPSDTQKAELKAELAAAQASLKEITVKSDRAERQLEELSDIRASLQTQIGELTQRDDAESASLAFVTQQRDSLQQQLNDTSNALTRAKEDLSRAQQDRQKFLLRTASLEDEVDRLNAIITVTDRPAANDEKLLAEDRDIRELMGARQLYISDVFDVQNNGERSKPFGRVFYTKGKSLIFYAFDLAAQPGYREAKAFQAWGQDDASAKPISLGIFYMDSEQNRRWVLKSDNPDVLAKINAVFVTVEPHGGSRRPTGKPFLVAYLHSLPPNHP
jgi:anti-sigma-K factor RskA